MSLIVNANSMRFSPRLSQLLTHSQYQAYKKGTTLWVRYVPFRRATEPSWSYFIFNSVLLMIIRSRMTSSLLQYRTEKHDPVNPFDVTERVPHVTHEFNNCKFHGSTGMIGRVAIHNPNSGRVIFASVIRIRAGYWKPVRLSRVAVWSINQVL